MTSESPTNGRIVVVFRNDDPSAISDLEHERKIFGLFEKYGVPQTIGVVPNITLTDIRNPVGQGERALCWEDPMADFLRGYVERTHSEIALHGYTHRTNRLSVPAKRLYSEFQRLGIAEQKEMLTAGMAILERALGIRPRTFIPPWNRLDRNTVRACAEVGLNNVSGKAHTFAVDGLACLGVNTDLAHFPAVLEKARCGQNHVFLTILFHSATIVHRDEIEALERALQLATEESLCQSATIESAAKQWPALLTEMNEAGRNAVECYELEESPRARSWLYLSAVPGSGRLFGFDRGLAKARELYWAGEYRASAMWGAVLDRKALFMLWLWRALLCGVGTLAGTLVFITGRKVSPSNTPLLLLGVAVMVVFGSWLVSRRALSRETRAEVLCAGLFLAAGFAALAGLRR